MIQLEGVRMWAFWRRVQYGAGYVTVLAGLITGVYFLYFYAAPTCFDLKMNGEEIGIDCGGACTRICAFTVRPPVIRWAQSFPANVGQYNAVAYVENANQFAGTPELRYTFTLKDREGIITTRTGTTVLPPDSTYPVFEGRIDTSGRVPTETTLTLEPADLWLPYAFGRAQFRTSDLALTGADSRPRLNARIENGELTPARDVEVVATIFDARGNPLTASQTFVPDIAARSGRDIVFTWPVPIAKTLRSCEVPTDVIMAIDLSGSMNNDGDNPPEPISSVLKAAESFVGQLRQNDRISLVTFATEGRIDLPLTLDTTVARGEIASLVIDPAEERGSTNTGDALLKAQSELNSPRHNPDARSVVVLLTDGLATAPDEEPETFALEAAAALREDDISVFTIGLGASVNMDFLRQLATTPEQAYAAPQTSTLASIYSSITAAICEDGAARIDVIPKTRDNFAPLDSAQ
jgi:Mg-chelatase subunit ChlD